MINIVGNRGDGKTTKIVEYANFLTKAGHKVAILVPHKLMAETYKARGLDEAVTIVAFSDFKTDSQYAKDYDILVDEAPMFLKMCLNIRNLAAISSDKEDIEELPDWRKTNE